MDGYLLDTNTISALLDSTHEKHAIAQTVIASIEQGAPKYTSIIALAELAFGMQLLDIVRGQVPEHLKDILRAANSHALLDVTRHTANEYGQLKARLAKHYLPTAIGKNRPRWLEDWVDRTTGKCLQVDENDLWMCAQARERNLVLLTADARMQRISAADPSVRLRVF